MIEVIKRNKLISNCAMRFGQSWLALGFKILNLLGPSSTRVRWGAPGSLFLSQATNWRWLIPFSKSRVLLNTLSLSFVQLLHGDLSFNTDFFLIKTDFLTTASFSFCFSDRNAEAQTTHEPDQVRNSLFLLPDLNIQLFSYSWFKSSTKPEKLSNSANCS